MSRKGETDIQGERGKGKKKRGKSSCRSRSCVAKKGEKEPWWVRKLLEEKKKTGPFPQGGRGPLRERKRKGVDFFSWLGKRKGGRIPQKKEAGASVCPKRGKKGKDLEASVLCSWPKGVKKKEKQAGRHREKKKG